MKEFLPVWHHEVKVSLLAGTIDREMNLDKRKTQLAAILHDIGKFTWPRELFYKPNRFLTENDWQIIFEHPRKSVEIIEKISGRESYLYAGNPSVTDIVLMHHEKPNGKEYYRITDIPPEAAVLSIANIYDACSSQRPYRVALPASVAIELSLKDFKDQSGSQKINLIKDILQETAQSSGWKKPPSVESLIS